MIDTNKMKILIYVFGSLTLMNTIKAGTELEPQPLKCPSTISKSDAEKIATPLGLIIMGMVLKANDTELFKKNLPINPSSQNNKTSTYSLKLGRQFEVNGQIICQYPYKPLYSGRVELEATLSNEHDTISKIDIRNLKCPATFDLLQARGMIKSKVRIGDVRLIAFDKIAFDHNLPSSSLSTTKGTNITFKPKLNRQIERNGQVICQYSYTLLIRRITKPLDAVLSD